MLAADPLHDPDPLPPPTAGDETAEDYLARKWREIAFLNSALKSPQRVPHPKSAADVVALKFALAGALKAERAASEWTLTETNWASQRHCEAGPYTFSFGYQRADLSIDGPNIYDVAPRFRQHTIYTCSGMAALSATFAAARRLDEGLGVSAPPDAYPETLELLAAAGIPTGTDRAGPTAVLVDSSVPTGTPGFDPRLAPDLVVFDTTCYWRHSLRIQRVLRVALEAAVPVALVRSHTKLDSLGVEYGRLGSIVLVLARDASAQAHVRLDAIIAHAEEAVRLNGTAAIPAHLAPFTESELYRDLSSIRIARIIRNHRLFSRRLGRIAGLAVPHQHGMYIAFAPRRHLTRSDAEELSEDLSSALCRQGIPSRHAGSFGFDFLAAEWFLERESGGYAVRLSLADLPAETIRAAADVAASWLEKHARRRPRRKRPITPG